MYSLNKLNKLNVFLLLNFFIAFFSDIVLNDLTKLGFITPLQTYFKDKLIIQAGLYAGLTILFALIPVLFISNLFHFTIPNYQREYLILFFITSIVGFVVDLLIKHFKIFGESLEPFYNVYYKNEYLSALLFGSGALNFTVFLSLLIMN